MNMLFCSKNYLNSTTVAAGDLSATSGDNTANLIFDRDASTVWETVGETSADTSTCNIAYRLPVGTGFDCDVIFMRNINLSDFQVTVIRAEDTIQSYKSLTITVDGANTVASFVGNSSANKILIMPDTRSLSGFMISAQSTTVAAAEKYIGEVWFGTKNFFLEKNPAANQYSPKLKRTEYSHKMSDGGTIQYIIGSSFETSMELTYQSASMTTALLSLYNESSSFGFVPYPTGTGWDGIIYEVNWIGDYTFLKPAKNDTSAFGWTGDLTLKETPK